MIAVDSGVQRAVHISPKKSARKHTAQTTGTTHTPGHERGPWRSAGAVLLKDVHGDGVRPHRVHPCRTAIVWAVFGREGGTSELR
jgi:hypothetical protein